MGTAVPSTLPAEFVERMVFLMAETGLFRPQLGGVVSFTGRLDESRLAHALRLLLDAEPVLGCRFMSEHVPPRWQRLEDLDSLRLLEVRTSDDPEAAGDAFIAEPFDVEKDPQVLAALVHGPEGDMLAVRVEHVAVDGGALKEMLYLLGSIYRTLAMHPDWTPEPNLDGIRHPIARAGPGDWLRALAARDMRVPPSDWGLRAPKEHGAPAYVTASLGPRAFRAAAVRAKALGATVNDVILTAEYRTLWRVFHAEPGSRTPMSVSCELRKHLPPGTRTGLSNISSAWHVSVPPVRDEEFEATLERVVQVTRRWKRGGAGRAASVLGPLVGKVTARHGLDTYRKKMARLAKMTGDDPRGGFGLTNIGVIDEALLDYGTDAPVADAWLLGPPSCASVILTASTFGGRLHMALGVEFAVMDERIVTEIVRGTVDEIETWAADSGQ